MGRRRIRRKAASAGAPSRFFMIALAVGVALLLVLFLTMVTRRAEPVPPHTSTSIESSFAIYVA
jgi:hypothetical protein